MTLKLILSLSSAPTLVTSLEKYIPPQSGATRKATPESKRNGQPMLYPSNSFLVKPSIVSERNKAAVENVFIIVQLIEQAGNNGIPHIKAKTLIERNEALKARLKKSTNPVQLLRRVFKKTWQLFREQTLLVEAYEDIELPDSNNIEQIPTFGNLDHVFNFRHKGKKRIYAPKFA